ncbi:MAG TPA: methyltransferase domain-containing protein [Puia sp.]|jgi:2-polyprenyl-3-methyl-5-hydroxy-6-metoxy-1,4-benzoquinol methylase
MDFSTRAYSLELLDQPGIPAPDIQRNLYELSIINKKLGGHNITTEGFFQLAGEKSQIVVCEIGCGGGDNLKAIEKKTKKSYPGLSLMGIDINEDCIQVAKKTNWSKPVRFLVSDYKKVHFESKPDIIFCSLFCHHFKEDELIDMFHWMSKNAALGFFINDLHRHAFAYYSIRALTRLFSKSYLVKNDAPLSVLRGFKKKEFISLLNQAGIPNYTIRWRWAFRWLIIVRS